MSTSATEEATPDEVPEDRPKEQIYRSYVEHNPTKTATQNFYIKDLVRIGKDSQRFEIAMVHEDKRKDDKHKYTYQLRLLEHASLYENGKKFEQGVLRRVEDGPNNPRYRPKPKPKPR